MNRGTGQSPRCGPGFLTSALRANTFEAMLTVLLISGICTAAEPPGWREGPELQRALDAKEHVLSQIDLESDDIRLKLLRSFEGFSILVKVQRRLRPLGKSDAWETVAAFKTSSGNTYAPGEVATYRLGRFLGHDIYPVTVPRTLGPRALDKLLARIEKKQYSGWKEISRLKVLWALRKHRRTGTPYTGVLKEWVVGFNYVYSSGFEHFPSRFRLARHLDRRRPQPPRRHLEFRVNDVIYFEHGMYVADTTYFDLARDVSSMIVIDALTGQHDRWPGANIHFRLFSGRRFRKVRHKRFVGGPARLFCLDNGATFQYPSRSITTLRTYVSRFDRRLIARLADLAAWVERDPPAVQRWLTINDRAFALFRRLLTRTADIVHEKTQGHPEAWFDEAPAPAIPAQGPPAPGVSENAAPGKSSTTRSPARGSRGSVRPTRSSGGEAVGGAQPS